MGFCANCGCGQSGAHTSRLEPHFSGWQVGWLWSQLHQQWAVPQHWHFLQASSDKKVNVLSSAALWTAILWGFAGGGSLTGVRWRCFTDGFTGGVSLAGVH